MKTGLWIILPLLAALALACADGDADDAEGAADDDGNPLDDDDDSGDDDLVDDDDNDDDDGADDDDDDNDDDATPDNGAVFVATERHPAGFSNLAQVVIYPAPTADRGAGSAASTEYEYSAPSVAYCVGRTPGVAPETLAETAGSPRLLCDQDGARKVVYCDLTGNKITYADDAGGEWNHIVLAEASDASACADRGFALDADGFAHVIYRDADAAYHVTNASGDWTTAVVKDAPLTDIEAATAADGAVHLTAKECAAINNCWLTHFRQSGAQWLETTVFTMPPASSYRIALKSSMLAVRGDVADVIYLHTWYLELPSPDLICANTTHEYRSDWPSWRRDVLPDMSPLGGELVASSSGADHLAYCADSCMDDYSGAGSYGKVRYGLRDGASWTLQTVDEADCGGVALAADPADHAHLAYARAPELGQLVYATNASGTWGLTVIAD